MLLFVLLIVVAPISLLFAALLTPFVTRGVQGMTAKRRAAIGCGIAAAVPVVFLLVLVIALVLAH
jgi:hypothetical protein